MAKINLVVAIPFEKYQKGDRIVNSSDVERILKSENSTNVVKVQGVDATETKADENQHPEA